MLVTILGAGSMARGIGTRLLAGGAAVQILGPDLGKAAGLGAELAQSGEVTPGTIGEQVAGQVIVLALPYPAVADILRGYASQLPGKTIVDITNPLNDTFDGLITDPGSSAAEEIAAGLPAGAVVVKAFNTTFGPTLIDGVVLGQPLDVFVAGDDVEAKTVVMGLVAAGGLNVIDVGALHRSRQLEAMALLHITLQGRLGTSFRSALKILR